MGGISIDDRIAIVRSGRGIQIDTYKNTTEMLFAVAYRFCADHSGDLTKFRELVRSVEMQVNEDWNMEPVDEDDGDRVDRLSGEI
jgi:hypothetical protein